MSFDLVNYYEGSFGKGYRATNRKPIQCYEDHRQHYERQQGEHDPGALGIKGWKGITWSGLRWLYQNGKLTTEKAEQIREFIAARYSPKSQIHKGFSKADHQANREALGLDARPTVKSEERTQATIGFRIAQLEAELASLRSGQGG